VDLTHSIKDLHEVKRLAVLGDGGFAQVVLVRYHGSLYAMKVLNKAHLCAERLAVHVERERQIGFACKSPFTVQLKYTSQDTMHVYMLMEPVLGGELFTYLEHHCASRNRGILEHTAAFFAACIVLAFEYLHDHNFIYRDLKPENLLIDEKGYIKITDFGFAKELTEGKTYTTCGTLDYMSPEMIQKIGHAHAADWWSLGVVIYEMVIGLPPFYTSRNDREKVEWIRKARLKFPIYVTSECQDLILNLMKVQPSRRLGSTAEGVDAIKKHPWFKTVDWKQLAARKHKVPYLPNPEKTLFTQYIHGVTEHSANSKHRVPLNQKMNSVFANF